MLNTFFTANTTFAKFEKHNFIFIKKRGSWCFLQKTLMALSTIVKKASSLLRLGSSDSLKPPPLDGEIIYCKNNVCVHPPASLLLDSEHHPGYLTLRAHQNEVRKVLLNKKRKTKIHACKIGILICISYSSLLSSFISYLIYVVQFTYIRFH